MQHRKALLRTQDEYLLEHPKATCACLNLGGVFCPDEIGGQSIYMDCDVGKALAQLSAL